MAALCVVGLAACGSERDRQVLAPGPLPHDFVGIVADDLVPRDTQYRRRASALLRGAGVGLVRQSFDWTLLEPGPGRFNPFGYDDFVRELARRRIRVMPVLMNPPPHRSTAPRESAERGSYPPREFEQFAEFAATLASRFGPRGSFWREHPSLPQVPVRSWQVWNEPSLPVYWRPRPDAAEYARLLRVTARAIRRVDPGAEIVSAGIPESRQGVPFNEYVNDLYDAGAGPVVDALAVHPYAGDAGDTVGAVRRARSLLRRRGWDTPIWVTELGWASGGPSSPFTVGEEGQARLIASALPALARHRANLGIRGVVYFNWRDAAGPYPGGRDFFGLHTGLQDRAGRPKPAYEAFAAAARALSR